MKKKHIRWPIFQKVPFCMFLTKYSNITNWHEKLAHFQIFDSKSSFDKFLNKKILTFNSHTVGVRYRACCRYRCKDEFQDDNEK